MWAKHSFGAAATQKMLVSNGTFGEFQFEENINYHMNRGTNKNVKSKESTKNAFGQGLTCP